MKGALVVSAPSIVITSADMTSLSRLIQNLRESDSPDRERLDLLDQILQGAEVRFPSRTQNDVVRMDSTVYIRDRDTGKKQVYTIVFPQKSDVSSGLVSVLAPLGLSLLGHRKGEVVEATTPGGVRKLRIERVKYAPSRLRRPPSPRREFRLRRPQQKLDLAA
jgi:regulator of nucleoside diphosphate kinase